MILFSAKISKKHQERLMKEFPEENFIFCNDMKEAKNSLSEAEILVTYGEDVTAEDVRDAKHLKWMMVLSAGIEKLPFKEIIQQDILITNARGIHKIPMAEYTIAMLLQVVRKAKTIYERQAEKQWDRSIKMDEISQKTMLIAGTGAIGQEVARLAKAFRMKTIGVSRSGRKVEHFDENHGTEQLHNELPQADFVVSVLPSTRETKYLFNEDSFRSMPNHAIFLNMGRGDVVQTEVLLEAVRNGEISHAVLDVFEEEPLPEDHPMWIEENITITPHLSGISPHYVSRALTIFERNLASYRSKGKNVINKIDLDRGY